MSLLDILMVLCAVWAAGQCQTITRVNYTDKAAISSLKLVQMVFRHGDRSPISIFPSDEHQIDSWPQGLGQLTPLGMEQAHELGIFLRNRYNGYLAPQYNLSELYVRSSDIDRTILTAQNMLSGLYPSKPEVDKAGNQWIPAMVPIHTVPAEFDYMLQISAKCPTNQDLFQKTVQTEKYTKLMADLQDLADLVQNNSGIQDFVPTMLGGVYDTLKCESHHNLSAPVWVTQSPFMERMAKEWYAYNYGAQFSSQAQARLKGGVLLQDMMDNIEAVAENLDARKMVAYSGHDTTIGAFVGALGVSNGLGIPYTSTVILELHKAQKNFTVRVYWRKRAGELYQLNIPNCPVDCPYTSFLRLTADVRPDDIVKECNSFDMLGLKVPLLFGLDRVMTITVVSITAGVVLIVFLICCVRCTRHCCRRRRLKNRRKVRNLNSIMPETVKLVSSGVSDSDDEFR